MITSDLGIYFIAHMKMTSPPSPSSCLKFELYGGLSFPCLLRLFHFLLPLLYLLIFASPLKVHISAVIGVLTISTNVNTLHPSS